MNNLKAFLPFAHRPPDQHRIQDASILGKSPYRLTDDRYVTLLRLSASANIAL